MLFYSVSGYSASGYSVSGYLVLHYAGVMAMRVNVGALDRKIRLALGAAIVILGLFFKSWLGLIGLILLATALIRWCPAYLPFGIDTCESKHSA